MMHSEEKAPTFDCEASATLGSKLYPAWPDCERDLRRAPTLMAPPTGGTQRGTTYSSSYHMAEVRS